MKNTICAINMLLLFIFLIALASPVSATKRVPILLYHSIDEFQGHGSKELYVTPTNFEKQMMYLRDHGFTLLTFERWEDIETVSKPIFITFDDGYKNNLNAFTILEKMKSSTFQPTGTLFVIADFIGRSNRLSSSDLKRVVDSGIFSIQSHSSTHPELTKNQDYNYELKASKEKIQQITGKPVIALAYPYGLFNDKVIQETKKYYLYGLTTISEPYMKKGIQDERFLLPRIYVNHSTTMEEFVKIVEGNKFIKSN